MDINNHYVPELLRGTKRFCGKDLFLSLLGFILTGGLLLGHAGAALADGSGNADVADNGCMQEVFGGEVNCNANDIQIANATILTIDDDGCAFPGDTVTFTAVFEVELKHLHNPFSRMPDFILPCR